MNEFDTYINSHDPAISKAASLLDSATAQYQLGALNKAEYTELTNDILDYNTVIVLISDMTRRQEIYTAFTTLASIIGQITSL